ncbi:chitin synthase regulator Skt5p [Trichomonascus vanleenenianus]|uniref:tetratricopeptide repeat protein n=1 Tax=Trichomonascus vanleenenianus TaxID=2268995 RepID=UPI003ECA0C87
MSQVTTRNQPPPPPPSGMAGMTPPGMSPGITTPPGVHQRAASGSFDFEYPQPTPGGSRRSSAQHLRTASQGSFQMPRKPRPLSSRSSVSSLDFNSVYHGQEAPHRASTTSPSLNELATQFASASMFDLSQSYIAPHMGSSANLMPRIKTIELYRKNAKKSNDPVIQFQFAQYMLQTALLSGTSLNPGMNQSNSTSSISSDSTNNTSGNLPQSTSSTSLPDRRSKHLSIMSTSSAIATLSPQEEKKLKADLLKEAIANLRKLSDKGFADAQYLLGDAYASGALGKPDLKESFNLFHLAAKHGHAEASYRAALCLEEGWGTSRDVRRSVQFLRSAASRNQPGAMLRLGLACFYGRLGLSGNVTVKQEGIKWLTRAAEAASEVYPQGPYELAKIYEVGYRDLIFQDYAYAVQLYVKSAELHYIPAAAKLGHAYEYGQLQCPQDAALSIHYYTIAALGGDGNSMLAMCAWYMVGADPVLPRNEEEAYEWALRAANCGLPKAQFAAGYFLENGIGAERDILQSTQWYKKAAAGGDKRAAERLRKSREMGSKSKKDKPDKDCIIM